MQYYLLRDDIDFPRRWYLGDVPDFDNWRFRDPNVEDMEPCTYRIEVYQDGKSLDFTLSEAYGVPVLSSRARDSLVGLPEVDEPYKHVVLEPVLVEGKSVEQEFYIMIIETQLDCVDEEKSEFQKFEADDPVRPDLAGNYRAFFNLVVDPSKIGNHHIFRLKRHLGSIVVSEDVKHRFEEAGVTGAVFESVNDDEQTVA